jgi:ATP-dependent Clp protease protease subunit
MKHYSILAMANKAVIKLIKGFSWWEENSKDFTDKIDSLLDEGITEAEVYLNTPGGDMLIAGEIVNQLKRFNKVAVKLGALCASSGTVVSSSFDDVEAAPNLQFMIHDPSWAPKIEHVKDWDSQKKLYINLRNDFIRVYKSKTGLSHKKLDQAMEATTWLNAKEAKEWGFIDRISDDPDNDALPEDTLEVLNKMGAKVPQVLNEAIKSTQNKETIKMKELAKQLGQPEDATEEQLIAAHNKAVKDAQEAALTAQSSEQKMALLMVVAERKGFDKEKIKAKAEKNFEVVAEMIMDAPEKTNAPANDGGEGGNNSPADNGERLSNALEEWKKNSGQSQAPANKKFSELTMAEKDALEAKDPKAFEALYNAEFGSVVNGH